MPRLAYLTLQSTREGQAAHAHVHEIVAGLERRGWQVTLYQPRYAATGPSILLRLWAFALLQGRLALGWRGYDAVYLRAHPLAWPLTLWLRLCGTPVCQEVNGPYEDLFLAWPAARRVAPLWIGMARSQYRHAAAVIAVTPDLAAWVRAQTGRTEVAVVPNGANHWTFTPQARTERPLPARYALFVGALAPWQGLELLLQALVDPAWPDDLALVVAGQGELAERVRAVAAGVPRLHYLGACPHAEVPGLMAGATLGLSVQTDLGGRARTGLYPLKLFEMMACGIPVLVSDFPGMADLVRQEGCGAVVSELTPAAVARAVAALAGLDAAQRQALGQAGRRAIEREHSWDARAGQTDGVLRSACLNAASNRRPA